LRCLPAEPALDFAQAPAQKQCPVQPPPANFYARWRAQTSRPATLHDAAAPPPEKLLQAIWQHQRLRRDQLRTLDGKLVRVLHPGFGSVEGGPDFHAAVLRFGSAEPVSGDVEVDLQDSGWRAHGHDRNPAFQNVILHVVWEGDKNRTPLPTIALKSVLDAPLPELHQQLEHHSIRALPESLAGKCCAPLRELPTETQHALLQQAAHVRLQIKAAQFRARAQHGGWEQALWEGLFRALGYKHNIWPMQQLAETRARWHAVATSTAHLQARLLGLSGLLPAELSRKSAGADSYLRGVWDTWWREREEFADYVLPRNLWRFHGQRPANHPLRRLALAAHWAHEPRLPGQIEAWLQQSLPDGALLPSLAKIFSVARDDFWSWHWTLRSARLTKPQPLLGAQRVTDLAVNVILPWLLARAETGRNATLTAEILRRYEAWPAAEDNSVLRLARQRLLGKPLRGRTGLNTASQQQGLLQIVRDFCEHNDSTCAGCQFPALVKQFVTMKEVCPPQPAAD
jgi:hypothetical protein